MSLPLISAIAVKTAAHKAGVISCARGEWAKRNDRGYSVAHRSSRTNRSTFFSTMTNCFKHRSPVPIGM